MNVLLVLALTLQLSLAWRPTTAEASVFSLRLAIVSPIVETLTAPEQELAQVVVAAATTWWTARWHIRFEPGGVKAHQVGDIREDYNYSWIKDLGYGLTEEPTIVVVVLDNSDTGVMFPSGEGRGVALYGYNVAGTTLARNGVGVDGPAATLAHELGHIALGLPDLYQDGCPEVDIMCNHELAYRQGRIGCESLAALSAPCRRVYLPVAPSLAPPSAKAAKASEALISQG